MREGITHLKKVAKEIWSNNDYRNKGKGGLIVFYAPVGYGKSVSAPLLAGVAEDVGVSSSLVHVLPSRNLVYNQLLCKYIYPLVDDRSERSRIEEICMHRVAKGDLAEQIKQLAKSLDNVAYQAGILIDYYKKAPMFEEFNILVSTFDSLAYTIFKNPVSELYKSKKHYAIPFSWIHTSLVYIDELHAYADNLEAISTVINAFIIMRIPVVAATATPIPCFSFEDYVISRDYFLTLRMCENENESKSENELCFTDDEFNKKVLSVSWHTKEIEKGKVVEKIWEIVKNHEERKVLVALDKVSDAVDLYMQLKKGIKDKINVGLIHGKMTKEKQEYIHSNLSQLSVLVTTPVINAGVDISFDVAFIGANTPEILIQFLGRVCRDNECRDAEVYLIKELMNQNLLNIVRESLKELNSDDRINWHLYFREYEGQIGYRYLIENYYKCENGESVYTVNIEKLIRSQMLALTPLLPSSRIDMAFKVSKYSLVREHLVEIITLDETNLGEMLKNLKDDELRRYLSRKAITVDLNRVIKVMKSNPIFDKLLLIVEQSYGYEIKSFNIPQKVEEYVEIHKKYRPLFSGVSLDASKVSKCYSDELGLWCI